MKRLNLKEVVVVGALSLGLLVGFPVSISAAQTNKTDDVEMKKEHHREMKEMGEKMLAQAKAQDAALQKMIQDLNQAPDAKKQELQTAILTKLVEQHHQMLTNWEQMHERMKGKGGHCKMHSKGEKSED